VKCKWKLVRRKTTPYEGWEKKASESEEKVASDGWEEKAASEGEEEAVRVRTRQQGWGEGKRE